MPVFKPSLEFSPGSVVNKMALNWDILNEVMSHLDRQDADRMSRTCRILHQSAPRFLLAGQIEIWDPAQFCSFYQFMMGRGRPKTFHYLRSLKLNIYEEWYHIPGLGDQIFTLFSESIQLEALDLNEVDLSEIDERIPQALAALLKLRTLEFFSPNARTLEMLREMKAPLAHIEGSFLNYNDPTDPGPLFARYRDTLESLRLEWVQIVNTEVQYPRLTTLSLSYCDFARIQPIIHCFPNVKRLYITMGDDDLFDVGEDPCRLDNLSSQTHAAWTSLEVLSGDIRSLYMLAVCSRVYKVDVWSLLTSDLDGQRLRMIIPSLHPTKLTLELQIPEFSTVELETSLATIQELLRHLKLELSVHGETYEDPTLDIIAVLEALSASSLSSLCFELHWESDLPHNIPLFDTFSSSSEDEDEEHPPLHPAPLVPAPPCPPTPVTGPSIADVDREALAEHAMRCIPTLRWFTVRIKWPLIEDTFSFVKRGKGPKKVVKVVRK